MMIRSFPISGHAANVVASHAALKVYLAKPEVESATVTAPASTRLAVTVARKGCTIDLIQRRASRAGGARHASGKNRSQEKNMPEEE